MPTVVFTQALNTGAVDSFNKAHRKLVRYSQKKGFKNPKKGELLAALIKRGLKDFDEAEYFS